MRTDRHAYISRGVFIAVLIILLYRAVSYTLMVGIGTPPFLFAEVEGFYQLFKATHIAQFITSGFTPALVFDILLFLSPVLFIVTLKRVFAIATTVLLLIYFLIFNMATGHHYHSLVGAIIITVPFWFKKTERFNLARQGVRYYWLCIFASAALWKILRGSVFYTEQLSNTLKSQQLDMLLQNPDTWQAQSVQYLIAHPQVSHVVLIINVLLQLSFLVGFFTKRFDRVLFWLAIIFCVANYFVMNIVSAELLILNFTLLNWEKAEIFTTKAISTLRSSKKDN